MWAFFEAFPRELSLLVSWCLSAVLCLLLSLAEDKGPEVRGKGTGWVMESGASAPGRVLGTGMDS